MKNRAILRLFAAPLFAAFTLATHAQANTFDVAAGGGVADYFGSGANSTKGIFEASGVYNFASHMGAGFEYAFAPLSSYNTNYGTYSQSGTDHLQHYGGVVRFPFVTTAHTEPYAAAHFGALHESATATASANGATASQSASANGGYFGASTGVSLFVSHHFGVRPELRYDYLKENGGHLHEMNFTVAVFYRFGVRK